MNENELNEKLSLLLPEDYPDVCENVGNIRKNRIRKKTLSRIMKMQRGTVAEHRETITEQKGTAVNKNVSFTGKKLRPLSIAAIAAALTVCLTTLIVAVSPEIREYWHLLFFREQRLQSVTEVPDGFIGITSYEELDAVREDLTGNYILMNDITMPDSVLWTPIQNFAGVFDGNGHVIRNLQISVTVGSGIHDIDVDEEHDTYIRDADVYVGLFGRAYGGNAELEWRKEEYIDENGDSHPYMFAVINAETILSKGIVRNLGFEGGRITVTGDRSFRELYVGVAAGRAAMIGGCYVKDVTIEVELSEEKDYYIDYIGGGYYVGGLCGRAVFTDSCYSYCSIEHNLGESAYVAGVTGASDAVVTSYFGGEIVGGERDAVSVCMNGVPVLIPQSIIDDVKAYSDSVGDEKIFMKFVAFYRQITASEENLNGYLPEEVLVTPDDLQNYFLIPVSETENYYMLDPYATAREFAVLSDILKQVYGENVAAACMAKGIKCGTFGCYDLRRGTPTFEEYDNTSIWTSDDIPTLRIFN